jgi:acyl-CoA synthetase (AMP-forming)/AMP-acid ligase II
MRDEAVVAYVVPREGRQATAAELIAFCAPRLATFKVPEIIELRTDLPRTPVGKIQKHLLRADARVAYQRSP